MMDSHSNWDAYGQEKKKDVEDMVVRKTVKTISIPEDVYVDSRERDAVYVVDHCQTCKENFSYAFHTRHECGPCIDKKFTVRKVKASSSWIARLLDFLSAR
jgi:hypothetical protein